MGRGGFDNLTKFCIKMANDNFKSVLDKYGKAGVDALKSTTPRDTGLTAESWEYEINKYSDHIALEWHNTNMTYYNIPVAILLYYGHGNGRGGYVQGRDFISPALQPLFDSFADEIWKEVTSA